MANEVTRQPCPKCGSTDTWMTYHGTRHFRSSRGYTESHGTNFCGRDEHFDRGCRRCQYEWATTDVLEEAASG